jgi:hypothetical protein
MSAAQEARLAALSNWELSEELSPHVSGALWAEVSLRLGIGPDLGNPLGIREADRLRRFQALWSGQPEGER